MDSEVPAFYTEFSRNSQPMEMSIDISKKILYNICIERGNDIMKPTIELFNDLCDHEVRIQSNLDYLQDAKQEAFAELGEALKGKDLSLIQEAARETLAAGAAFNREVRLYDDISIALFVINDLIRYYCETAELGESRRPVADYFEIALESAITKQNEWKSRYLDDKTEKN